MLLATDPLAADPLTRYEVVDEWLVECRSHESRDRERCLVRSGPHVARTGQEVSGFTFTVDPGGKLIGVESKAALGLEARVDSGELFSTVCGSSQCAFSAGDARRLMSEMRQGSVLLARIVTTDGQVVEQLTLDNFREALAIAKQPRELFQEDRLTGLDIRALQGLLASRGYDPGPKDGILGPRTRRAIASYQQDNALTQDGEPSKALLFRLRSEE